MPPKRKKGNEVSPSPGNSRYSAGSPTLRLSPTRAGGGGASYAQSPGSPGSAAGASFGQDQSNLDNLLREFPTLDARIVRETYEEAARAGHAGRARKSLKRLAAKEREQQQLGKRPSQPEPEPAPVASAMPYPPRKDPKDQHWKELTKRNQKYVEKLGWTQGTWEGGDQTPFAQLWSEMTEEQHTAASALCMAKTMFAHSDDAEDFWITIKDVKEKGLIGMSIAHTVNNELDQKSLLWGIEATDPRDPAESLRVRLTALLDELQKLEGYCEKIRDTALRGDDFEDMKMLVVERSQLAQELYPQVDDMLEELATMDDELQARCSNIRACQEKVKLTGAELPEDEGLEPCPSEEMRQQLEKFYEKFDQNGYDVHGGADGAGGAKEGTTVLGEDLQILVRDMTQHKTRELEILGKVATGIEFSPEQAATEVREAKIKTKEIWEKLVAGEAVAESLHVTGRDFLESQLNLAEGMQWDKKENNLHYSAGGEEPELRPEGLWTRLSTDCLNILRSTARGTNGPESAVTPRLYTVQGVAMLTAVLQNRKDLLEELAVGEQSLEAKKSEFGKEAVMADIQINVLTHKLWITQNRMLELT